MHLSDQLVFDLLEGRLDEETNRTARAHLDQCDACRTLIAESSRLWSGGLAGDAGAESATALVRGSLAGRYIVIDRLGSGGMGIVYSAFDPHLDRKIALKLHRFDGQITRSELEARLAREARVMAKLSHPNVLPVFDAGIAGDRTFVAMELVDGRTLREHLDHSPPNSSETLRLLLQAARGLSAAHAAGIVHRDFKPENVLIGKDGRARVADFGLANVVEGTQPEAEPGSNASGVLGTPPYMAPERIRGEAATPASDQFAFAVTLYEGLFGQRPFIGKNREELWRSISEGAVRPPPSDSKAPAHIRRAVLRALSARPEDRFPSMAALSQELERSSSRPRSIWVGSIALAAAAGTAWMVSSNSPRVCAGAQEQIAASWNLEKKASIAATLGAAPDPRAAKIALRFGEVLDDYVARWIAMHTEACEATRVHGHQSAELLDQRIGCLHQLELELAATVAEFSLPERDLIDRAVTAASGLKSIERCAADRVLRTTIDQPISAEAAPKIEAIRAELAKVAASGRAGKYQRSLALVEPLLTAVNQLDYRPIEAEVFLAQSNVFFDLRRAKEAEASFEETIRRAAVAKHDRVLADALVGSVYIIGVTNGRLHDARERVRLALPVVARVADPFLEAELTYYSGMIRHQLADREGARADYRRALEIWERTPSAPEYRQGVAVIGLARLARETGDFALSKELFLRALAIEERGRGADHPKVAVPLNNLGNLFADLAEYSTARDYYLRAQMLTEARGKETNEYLLQSFNLAEMEVFLGEEAAGISRASQALEVSRRIFGEKHPRTTNGYGTVGWLLLETGRREDAARHLEKARATILETVGAQTSELLFVTASLAAARGAAGVETASTALSLWESFEQKSPSQGSLIRELCARAYLAAGRLADARREIDRSRIDAEKLPPGHPNLAAALACSGETYLAEGKPELARPVLLRAQEILQQRKDRPHLAARIAKALR